MRRSQHSPRSSGSFIREAGDDPGLVTNTGPCSWTARRGTVPRLAGVTQLVECQPSKLKVVGSSLTIRF